MMDINEALRFHGEAERGPDAATIGAAVRRALAAEVDRLRAEVAALEMARFDAAHKAEEWEESAAIERKRADDAEARLDALVGAAQRERKALRARHVAMSAHTAAISREQCDADEVLRTGRAESEAIQRAREATAAMDAAMVAVGCP